MRYQRPVTLPVALQALTAPGSKPLAGGTDLLTRLGTGEQWPTELVDLKSLPELQRIEVTGDTIRIGAAVPLARLHRAEELTDWPALLQACRVFAARQIRERATLGGNLANASPAADTVPALVAYDAVCLTDHRRIPVEYLASGPGRTILQPGEIILAIEIPRPAAGCFSFYHKLATRDAMAISLVGVAAALQVQDHRISGARIALGSVAPTVIRALNAENELSGKQVTKQVVDLATRAAADEASPIDDIRATAGYRRKMIRQLLGYHLKRFIQIGL
jgi:CO/xanthine dehydrogenase FAD-binding subunit